MGCLLCALATGVVLLFNVVLTVVVSARNGGGRSGLAILYQGDCTATKWLDVWFHLIINALGSLLLGASNYCMQCLSAPTRKDIDKAHAQHRWLDIGIQSFRNLRYMSRFKVMLWGALAVSSIPLHVFYNGAFFSTQASYQYGVFIGSPSLLTGEGIDWSEPVTFADSFKMHWNGPRPDVGTLDQFRDVSSWTRLNDAECLQAYAKNYIIDRGDVVVVSSDTNTTVPAILLRMLKSYNTDPGIYGRWPCSAFPGIQCDLNGLQNDISNWALNDTIQGHNYDTGETYLISHQYAVDYCLSRPMPERCSLELSLVMMGIVMACNAIKLFCMVLLLYHYGFAPLTTLGDAIESFVVERDNSTQGMCLADEKTFKKKDGWKPAARPYSNKRPFWFAAASKARWFLCNLSLILVLVAAGILFHVGTVVAGNGIEHTFWSKGFGVYDRHLSANWRIRSTRDILGATLLANFPQLLVSFLYLMYNSIYTCMLLAAEWDQYAHQKKPLRVSRPSGEQESSYRLQLPYRYAIPLLILSAVLHWLVSRSLFIARVAVYTREGERDQAASLSRIGYSLAPIAVAVILGSILLLAVNLMGFRRFKPGIPLVGSCSAAISAACHTVEGEDIKASEKRLAWGVCEVSEEKENDDEVGHCCFTAREATKPIPGKSYA